MKRIAIAIMATIAAAALVAAGTSAALPCRSGITIGACGLSVSK